MKDITLVLFGLIYQTLVTIMYVNNESVRLEVVIFCKVSVLFGLSEHIYKSLEAYISPTETMTMLSEECRIPTQN